MVPLSTKIVQNRNIYPQKKNINAHENWNSFLAFVSCKF